jgi:CheY-like chemotaxis protein
MGGSIRLVRSAVDKGSVFQFDIRAAVAEGAEIESTQPLPRRVIGLAPEQPTYRILVVEDRWENRQVLVRLLQPLGFAVSEASNGQEGIDTWDAWEPHLILMDMRMPVMDGYEATRRIKGTAKGQATAIIALTASAFEEDRSLVLSAGCNDFLRKPFREADLFERLARHLGVQFIYQDTPNDEEASETSRPLALTPAALAVLPAAWRSALAHAAHQGDDDQARHLIEQVQNEHPDLAAALLTLVDALEIDQIAVLLANPRPEATPTGDMQ